MKESQLKQLIKLVIIQLNENSNPPEYNRVKENNNEPLGDVWTLETPKEEIAAEHLSNIASQALDGNKNLQEFLIQLWDGESWPSIKKKLETEGSVWYVWWMDGVRKFIREHFNESFGMTHDIVSPQDTNTMNKSTIK